MLKRICIFSCALALVLSSRPALSDWTPPAAGDPHTTWVYRPSSTLESGQHGLMLVLHGCSQANTDLKRFGHLEEAAEDGGIILAVPSVGSNAFGPGCWDYNGAADLHGYVQDMIALTRNLLSRPELNIDGNRVYAVGLSSGAALSLLLGCKAPDLFSGIGAIAGPSVGSNQLDALNPGLEIPSTNVAEAISTCKGLAGDKAPFLADQVANIAYGDMDRDGPDATFKYTPGDTKHPGQYSVVSIKWSLDNISVLRNLYGADELSPPRLIQDGRGIEQSASVAGATRLSLLVVHNVGHAWPAGSNNADRDGLGGVWIAQEGLDYASYVTRWFLQNARRANPVTR